MDYRNYDRFAARIRQKTWLLKLINNLNKVVTGIGFLMYPVLIAGLWFKGQKASALVCVIIPGLAFITFSAYRKWRNSPRPYETYGFTPLIKRDGSGESFPSRHTFSIMLIGGLWWLLSPVISMVVLICGLGLAAIRVIGGVHYIKDIVWGAGLGIGSALITVVIAMHFLH